MAQCFLRQVGAAAAGDNGLYRLWPFDSGPEGGGRSCTGAEVTKGEMPRLGILHQPIGSG